VPLGNGCSAWPLEAMGLLPPAAYGSVTVR